MKTELHILQHVIFFSFFYHSYLNCRRAQQLIKPKKKENKPRPLSVEGTFIKPGLCNLLLSPHKAGGHAAKEAHFPAEADKHLPRFNVCRPRLAASQEPWKTRNADSSFPHCPPLPSPPRGLHGSYQTLKTISSLSRLEMSAGSRCYCD